MVDDADCKSPRPIYIVRQAVHERFRMVSVACGADFFAVLLEGGQIGVQGRADDTDTTEGCFTPREVDLVCTLGQAAAGQDMRCCLFCCMCPLMVFETVPACFCSLMLTV